MALFTDPRAHQAIGLGLPRKDPTTAFTAPLLKLWQFSSPLNVHLGSREIMALNTQRLEIMFKDKNFGFSKLHVSEEFHLKML